MKNLALVILGKWNYGFNVLCCYQIARHKFQLDIEQRIKDGIRFKVLSLEQYLQVYSASARDGYRINVRKKKDNDKIVFIEKHLNTKYI